MKSYDELAQELFEIMDPQKHRPPHEPMNKMMHGEMAVMRLLDKEDSALPAGEISRKLCMTTSRIAAVLNALEKKQMIIRRADAQDKRRVLVDITEAGKVFCCERRSAVKQHMQTMLEQMGEHDAAEYVRLTRRAFELMHGCQNEGGIE